MMIDETLNINSLRAIREAWIKALTEALGPVGTIRFMQQFEDGHGDYAKEKYDQPDITIEEFEEWVRTMRATGKL